MPMFKAFVIDQDPADNTVRCGFTSFKQNQLDAGEVLIHVQYSSVNFKDALAATGQGKVVRRFPCIGGIDLAGEVVQSDDTRFHPGMQVIATSYDIGVAHHGGYAEYARIPADWVIPLPQGLTPAEAMTLGTAGLTAGLAVTRMEAFGLTPEKGPVIVTGATGGVGSFAVDLFAKRGYHVTAVTSKTNEIPYLETLGAKEVILRNDIQLHTVRALEKAVWAGAIDNLGGEMLHWILATMKQAGIVASIGNAASPGLTTTVFPFILRGISLIGIDSGYSDQTIRQSVWKRLGTDLKPLHLTNMTHMIDFDDLPAHFNTLIEGKGKGRTVVRIGG